MRDNPFRYGQHYQDELVNPLGYHRKKLKELYALLNELRKHITNQELLEKIDKAIK